METIDNRFYDELGEYWYAGEDHPIALLRAENRLRNPWIASKLPKGSAVLDVGCGGGLLANFLAVQGFQIDAIDLSRNSLILAKQHDVSGTVRYQHGDAMRLPFEDRTFDAVTAMDLLEHVDKPELVISEAGRVLKDGGLFFFHTFNRNWLSWLLAVKGVSWCVVNAPKNLHVYSLFIKPEELAAFCGSSGLRIEEMIGVAPKICSPAFWKTVMTRRVSEAFSFVFTPSLKTGYCGVARKLQLLTVSGKA